MSRLYTAKWGHMPEEKNKLHWGSHDGTFQSLSDLSRMYSLLDGWKLAHLTLKREEKGSKSVAAKRIKLTSDLHGRKGESNVPIYESVFFLK